MKYAHIMTDDEQGMLVKGGCGAIVHAEDVDSDHVRKMLSNVPEPSHLN
jgi:hypothetical protein